MFTAEKMQKLAEFVFTNRDKIDLLLSPSSTLIEEIRKDIPKWEDDSIEEVTRKVQDILEDLDTRHSVFNSPYKDVFLDILNEVNFQLSTSKVHLYTLVPIRGLDADLNYREKVQISEGVYVRRIQKWEVSKFDFLLLQNGESMPEFAFEWVREINPLSLENEWFNDNYIEEVRERTKLLLSLLQTQQIKAMVAPWIIQYVPHCQHIGNKGKISATIFPATPIDFGDLFKKEDFLLCNKLTSERLGVDEVIRRKLNIALNRFYEANNRLNESDKLVDYWIALEALFGKDEPGQTETRQLAIKIASYLFENFQKEDRINAFVWIIQISYPLRCRIVHGDHQNNPFILAKVTEQTQKVITLIIRKLLQEKLTYEQIIGQINRISFTTNFPSGRDLQNSDYEQTSHILRMENLLDQTFSLSKRS